jgi:succinate dehydrogenase / fumarate reductase flavoprotein subunit
MPDYDTVEHDVLIIGSGGAGLRAAIEASATGVSVGMVSKCLLGKAHTVMAEGGIAAALANVDDRDNWKVHFADTMRGGQYVNNWRMAELHAKEAPDRVRELEAWGAVFDRTPDGRILQRNFGGHKYPRLAHVGDRTGLELIRTLQDRGVHRGIDVHMEVCVTELLMEGGRAIGAFGYDRERGRFKVFRARAVVLATGGVGKAYKISSNSWDCTGDGHALAYHAGAALIDMEYIQFHPTGMIWPPSVCGMLATEGVRGEGGILTNKEGRVWALAGLAWRCEESGRVREAAVLKREAAELAEPEAARRFLFEVAGLASGPLDDRAPRAAREPRRSPTAHPAHQFRPPATHRRGETSAACCCPPPEPRES